MVAPTSPSTADLCLPPSAKGRDGRTLAAARPGLVGSTETSAPRIRAYRGERRVSRLRRGVPLAAELINQVCGKGGFRHRVAMLTLTYRPGASWEPRHVSELQEHIRKHLDRRQIVLRGVWVLELTKRGVPHYHLLLWLPKGITLPKPDKRGWWPHGLTKIEWARNAIGYLVKYASKAKDDWEAGGRFPPGSRLFGARGLGDARPHYSHRMRPFWLRDHCEVGDRLVRSAGGGWTNVTTGEWLESPFVLVARCPHWRWVEFALRSPASASEVVA